MIPTQAVVHEFAAPRRVRLLNRVFRTFAVAAVFLLPGLAVAQTPVPQQATALQRIKQPVDWLTLAGDFRARNEYFNNAVTLAPTALHEQDVVRFRGRLSATAKVAQETTLTARVVAEPRYWVHPAFVGACRGETNWESRFVMFDAFNAKWTRLFGQDLTLTLGRQDIQLAEATDCWLVADGTPSDGSWSIFLDAARLSGEVASLKTKFDLVLISQDSRPGAWLPTLGRATSYPVTDQDERGAILYVSNKSIPSTQFDAYAMYKNDRRRTFVIAGVPKAPGDRADIGTFGGRVTGSLPSSWTYSVEGAVQVGSKQDRIAGVMARRDIRAYGGKGRLTHAFKDALNNQLTFSGEVLSGDDPSTKDTDEMFDVLWGRWPRWSELYIYSYINETGGRIAQLNNLVRLGSTWTFAPVTGATCSLTYQALYAVEPTPTRAVAPALFSRDGRFRGHYVQAFVKHQFNKHVSGHLWFEGMWQGGFYAQREFMSFARAEVMFAF